MILYNYLNVTKIVGREEKHIINNIKNTAFTQGDLNQIQSEQQQEDYNGL